MKAKRILSFLLVLVLCVAMFPATNVSAISTSSVEANLTSWRSNLDGKYWNYYDRSVYDSRRSYVQSQLISIATSGILSNSNATDAQVGVTSTACAGPLYESGCRSNYFAGAWQCRSFARFIDYALFGSTWAISSSDWTQYNTANLNYIKLQPGDHIVSSGHEAIIWKVSNGKISCVECWGGSGCKINYSSGFNGTKYTTESGLLSYLIADGGSVWRHDSMLSVPAVARIKTDKTYYAVDERVQFTFETDGTKNVLWIYCPNGDTLTYTDAGDSYGLGFGMSGHFQALVQTWNGIGSCISDRIDFYVGKQSSTIQYNANGGSNPPATQTGEITAIPTKVPTRFGYNFCGWSKSASATSADYQPGDSITINPGETWTLYAVWRAARKETIKYNLEFSSLMQTRYSHVWIAFEVENSGLYNVSSCSNVGPNGLHGTLYDASGKIIRDVDSNTANQNFDMHVALTAGTVYYVEAYFNDSTYGEISFWIARPSHFEREEPTCTKKGAKEYWYCSGCNIYYLQLSATASVATNDPTLPALGHSYTKLASSQKATDATCTKAATWYVQCDRCDAVSTTATVAVGAALGHSYSNGSCTRCGAADPNAAEPDPNAAVVSVVPVRGKAGQTVEVTVTLENNPGFSDLSLEIGYDADVIELTKVTPNSAVGCIFTTSQQLTQLPYRLNWVNGTEDSTFTGTLVTLTFQIKDSAELGSYPVTVSYYKGKYGNNIDGEDVNYNQNGSRVPIIYVNGSVTVYSYTPGDLNGDGRINSKDAIYLLRYIAGWELDGLVEDALDVNGDGKINSKDAVHLLRYIAGWDVTLH